MNVLALRGSCIYDFGQPLADLQISIAKPADQFSFDADQELGVVEEAISLISSDLADLSHQLHPSVLAVLGLVAALRTFCRDFAKQHRLCLYFAHKNIPEHIPMDVSLSLFRIVQEALRNLVKHSGAGEVTRELLGHDETVELVILDTGKRFDASFAKGRQGLGLVSMRERLRLIGGEFSIQSFPLRGNASSCRRDCIHKAGPGAASHEPPHTNEQEESKEIGFVEESRSFIFCQKKSSILQRSVQLPSRIANRARELSHLR